MVLLCAGVMLRASRINSAVALYTSVPQLRQRLASIATDCARTQHGCFSACSCAQQQHQFLNKLHTNCLSTQCDVIYCLCTCVNTYLRAACVCLAGRSEVSHNVQQVQHYESQRGESFVPIHTLLYIMCTSCFAA
jgi:hypothetical protein